MYDGFKINGEDLKFESLIQDEWMFKIWIVGRSWMKEV